jgi:hypothetical protein
MGKDLKKGLIGLGAGALIYKKFFNEEITSNYSKIVKNNTTTIDRFHYMNEIHNCSTRNQQASCWFKNAPWDGTIRLNIRKLIIYPKPDRFTLNPHITTKWYTWFCTNGLHRFYFDKNPGNQAGDRLWFWPWSIRHGLIGQRLVEGKKINIWVLDSEARHYIFATKKHADTASKNALEAKTKPVMDRLQMTKDQQWIDIHVRNR